MLCIGQLKIFRMALPILLKVKITLMEIGKVKNAGTMTAVQNDLLNKSSLVDFLTDSGMALFELFR